MSKADSQVSFRVPREWKEKLEQQARRERRSVSSLILKVMEDYLESKAKKP